MVAQPSVYIFHVQTCDAEVNDMREFIAKCLPPQ